MRSSSPIPGIVLITSCIITYYHFYFYHFTTRTRTSNTSNTRTSYTNNTNIQYNVYLTDFFGALDSLCAEHRTSEANIIMHMMVT